MLKEQFRERDFLTTKDIDHFYRQTEPEVKTATIHWRIYHLVQSGVLARIGKGKYALGAERLYIPAISPTIKSLYRDIHQAFPFISLCVWSTTYFNEFMLHQPGKFYTLVEVSKEATQSVFYFLSEKKKNVFLEPNKEVVSLYASKHQSAIIVQSLTTEAPLQFTQNMFTASLEKMLVDLFVDTELFTAQQGTEQATIFQNALQNYTLNQDKMLRYADRRRKKEAFKNYLKNLQIIGSKPHNAANSSS